MSDKQQSSDQQVIFLSGVSHGGNPGDRRTVDPETAANLVAAGLATYPKSK